MFYDKQEIQDICAHLRQSGVIQFSLGLGCLFGHENNLSGLLKKQRPKLFVKDLKMAMDYAVFYGKDRQIAEIFWPGALHLVLPRSKAQGSIEICSPRSPFCTEIFFELDRPILFFEAVEAIENFDSILPVSDHAEEKQESSILMRKDEQYILLKEASYSKEVIEDAAQIQITNSNEG